MTQLERKTIGNAAFLDGKAWNGVIGLDFIGHTETEHISRGICQLHAVREIKEDKFIALCAQTERLPHRNTGKENCGGTPDRWPEDSYGVKVNFFSNSSQCGSSLRKSSSGGRCKNKFEPGPKPKKRQRKDRCADNVDRRGKSTQDMGYVHLMSSTNEIRPNLRSRFPPP
ncbi:hypothetical protein GALMADRAFT_279241 [Galerina marginata CBS 339.88]|uniref:Uncharacterized protein n=1 Tax=Galerina marginata (strain CBS 339.88) TaxID=685588 RepID=A0A067T2X7_GALM3|nr:hypothetical protein GALMADRAFT_279241 [Galerina marginata CBS 339.88]